MVAKPTEVAKCTYRDMMYLCNTVLAILMLIACIYPKYILLLMFCYKLCIELHFVITFSCYSTCIRLIFCQSNMYRVSAKPEQQIVANSVNSHE